MEYPICEVCGKPATITMRDVYVNDNWDTRQREFSPVEELHHFCKEHERPSELIDITMSPLTWFYNKNNG